MSVALLQAIREGTLDAVRIPRVPLDVLATAGWCRSRRPEWSEQALFENLQARDAVPDAQLEKTTRKVLQLVSEASPPPAGVRGCTFTEIAVQRHLAAAQGARLRRWQNGGAIPDTFSYAVVAEPDEKQVGTLDEDFAVESMRATSSCSGALRGEFAAVFDGKVRVENRERFAPTVPFWLGEAPARTDELSHRWRCARGSGRAEKTRMRGWKKRLGSAPAMPICWCATWRAGSPRSPRFPPDPLGAERFFDDAAVCS